MEKKLLELKDILVKNTETIRELHEEIAELKAKGNEVPEELTLKFDSMNEKLDKLEKDIADAEKQREVENQVETFMDSAKTFMDFAKQVHKSGRKTTVEILDCKEQVTLEEQKALSTDIDPNGGYWLKPTYSGRIREFIVETSPIRGLATVETVPAGITEHIVPVELNDKTGCGWVSERGTRTETATPEQGIVRIPLNEVYADPAMTQQIMLNPTFNTEQWLRRKVAMKIARTENTAFVNGDGVGKPQGFMTSDKIGVVETAASGVIDFDDLINLQTESKDEYNANAVFAYKRTTLRTLRTIKDNQGRYIWEPSGKVGVPSSLLGDPSVLMDDMPEVAAGSKPIIRADFKELYTIVDAGGLRLLIDPYTKKGFIEFYWSKYVGGAVVQPDAGKILKVKS